MLITGHFNVFSVELNLINFGAYLLEVGAEGETSGSFTGGLTKPSLLYKDIGFEAGN